MSSRNVVLMLALVVAAGLVVGLGGGCAEPPRETTVTVGALDQASYAALVHPVFEQACGSPLCHGKEPRGLRVYGATALRLPGATGPTTPDEITATYLSIVGLEPEKLNAFLGETPRTETTALKLLVLAKPLTIERHRGGISLRKGEPAEQCILSWLLAPVDASACAAAKTAK
jgi:hypothetical protein